MGELRTGGFHLGAPADLDAGVGALAAAFASVMQVDTSIISAPSVQAGAGPLRVVMCEPSARPSFVEAGEKKETLVGKKNKKPESSRWDSKSTIVLEDGS